MTADLDILTPREFRWHCCGVSAADVANEDTEIVELLMVLARQVTDENGLKIMFRLPPALAAQIVLAFKSGNPVEYIQDLCDPSFPNANWGKVE